MVERSDTAGQLWVHGNSGILQTSYFWRMEVIGYYLRVKAEGPNEAWLHFAPPTIVSSGTYLSSVLIDMRTWGTAKVDKVHVYSGARQVLSVEDLGLSSDTGEVRLIDEDDGAEFWRFEITLDTPAPVRSAVGVSLLIVANHRLDALAVSAVGLQLTPV
jgi:hypothetical protein